MAARGGGAPCGACKFLRRKCVKECVFAPYFSTEELGAAHFAAIHKIFGASNFSKLLQSITWEQGRIDAAVSMSYEAQARLQDPTYGCVSHIFALQQQVALLEAELSFVHFRLTCSSDRSSSSPSPHAEQSTSSQARPYNHYSSLKEPHSSRQSTSENVAFPKSMDFYKDLSVDQSMNAFKDERNSWQPSQMDEGDLHALAFEILTSLS